MSGVRRYEFCLQSICHPGSTISRQTINQSNIVGRAGTFPNLPSPSFIRESQRLQEHMTRTHALNLKTIFNIIYFVIQTFWSNIFLIIFVSEAGRFEIKKRYKTFFVFCFFSKVINPYDRIILVT